MRGEGRIVSPPIKLLDRLTAMAYSDNKNRKYFAKN